MKKVANKKIIRTLSYRTMREKKWKNLIAILAIALTALLFTSVFTVGSSLISSMEEASMRQVGSRCHGGYKHMTMEEYERVKAAGGYTDISYDIFAGFATNAELADIQTEVRYMEDDMARWSFCYPEKGKMPEEINECVASGKVLEALGIPMELGAKVPLTVTTHDAEGKEKVIEEEFVLCGYYLSNEASHAQEFAISEKWLEANVDMNTRNYQKRMEENGAFSQEGYLQVGLWFDSSFDIESRMAELTRQAGFEEWEVSESVNWAYATANVDVTTVILLIVIVGVIILSGYLIIYNIFYINVTTDIRYYGLLKTIGTTGKQLRRMVRQQALFLSAAGIPLGLLGGWLVGRSILPAFYRTLHTGGVKNVELNGFIFAGSAVFSLLVVFLSCIRPCRLASRVSPIEAVRYVENTSVRKKEKKTARVSAARLAAANMGRNRKKAAMVIASLSLSLILLNATYCLVRGFSFEDYVKTYLVSDMQLTHGSMVNMVTELDPWAVLPEMEKVLEETEGISGVDDVYYANGLIFLSDKILEKFENYYTSEEYLSSRPFVAEAIPGYLENKSTYADNYCLDKDLMELIDIEEGTFDVDKFNQGGYALLLQTEETKNWISVGDKITVGSYEDEETGKRPQKELEIMAYGDIPYSLTTRRFTIMGGMLLLSEKDFEELYETAGALHACLTVEEGKEELVQAAITELMEQSYPELTLITRESLREEFKDEMRMFSTVGGLLGAILALIGILNFINAMITGILSRKQEFAMMQAVGMTGRQLENMLTMEGIWYGVWILVISVTIGNVINYGLLHLMEKMISGFHFGFHILPLVISIPVIAFISVALPVICYHALCKKSIIERLRLTEV